jgi:hypothetical protein
MYTEERIHEAMTKTNLNWCFEPKTKYYANKKKKSERNKEKQKLQRRRKSKGRENMYNVEKKKAEE